MKRKLGILGGGQLARMMIPTCLDWDIDVRILDQEGCVASGFCRDFVAGSFQDQNEIVETLSDRDVVTVDLESVSLAGVQALEDKGIYCAPSSHVLSVIQDKYLQKQFFKDHDIPTSGFELLHELSVVTPKGYLKIPRGGYDGKGVCAWNGEFSQIPVEFKKDVLWEERIDIDKEISVIVARGYSGETQCYLPTEMNFDSQLNLISHTFYPARIEKTMQELAMALAIKICEQLGMVGVMAVEMFINKKGEILVNELAPRPHNSGHHTIESSQTSQFENHIRAVIGLPLGGTKRTDESKFALTFNIVGKSDGYAQWLGLGELLGHENIFVHNYGKKECRNGRKMGHVTVLGKSETELITKYKRWSRKIKVVGSKE